LGVADARTCRLYILREGLHFIELLAQLIEAGLPATVRWLVISQKECDAEDAKAGGGVWKATRRMVETAVRERLVAERATMGGVN
jgi:hypothetical protein